MIDEDKSTLSIRESAYVTRAIEDIRKRDIPNRKRVTSVTAVTCDFKVFHTLAQLT